MSLEFIGQLVLLLLLLVRHFVKVLPQLEQMVCPYDIQIAQIGAVAFPSCPHLHCSLQHYLYVVNAVIPVDQFVAHSCLLLIGTDVLTLLHPDFAIVTQIVISVLSVQVVVVSSLTVVVVHYFCHVQHLLYLVLLKLLEGLYVLVEETSHTQHVIAKQFQSCLFPLTVGNEVLFLLPALHSFVILLI